MAKDVLASQLELNWAWHLTLLQCPLQKLLWAVSGCELAKSLGYILDIHLRYVWDMPEIYLRYTQDLPETHLRYTFDIHKIYLRYPFFMPEIYLRHTLCKSQACYKEHLRYILGYISGLLDIGYISSISQAYLKCISCIYQVFPKNFLGISHEYIRHFSGISMAYFRHFSR